eukprot:GHVT01099185.1.p1 GENE.GHVT01099185.1~~GHVT01099185.1.p1  ORF type:complete len:705 (+),score=19.34 GHVT01099185.1:1419-3533(+)
MTRRGSPEVSGRRTRPLYLPTIHEVVARGLANPPPTFPVIYPITPLGASTPVTYRRPFKLPSQVQLPPVTRGIARSPAVPTPVPYQPVLFSHAAQPCIFVASVIVVVALLSWMAYRTTVLSRRLRNAMAELRQQKTLIALDVIRNDKPCSPPNLCDVVTIDAPIYEKTPETTVQIVVDDSSWCNSSVIGPLPQHPHTPVSSMDHAPEMRPDHGLSPVHHHVELHQRMAAGRIVKVRSLRVSDSPKSHSSTAVKRTQHENDSDYEQQFPHTGFPPIGSIRSVTPPRRAPTHAGRPLREGVFRSGNTARADARSSLSKRYTQSVIGVDNGAMSEVSSTNPTSSRSECGPYCAPISNTPSLQDSFPSDHPDCNALRSWRSRALVEARPQPLCEDSTQPEAGTLYRARRSGRTSQISLLQDSVVHTHSELSLSAGHSVNERSCRSRSRRRCAGTPKGGDVPSAASTISCASTRAPSSLSSISYVESPAEVGNFSFPGYTRTSLEISSQSCHEYQVSQARRPTADSSAAEPTTMSPLYTSVRRSDPSVVEPLSSLHNCRIVGDGTRRAAKTSPRSVIVSSCLRPPALIHSHDTVYMSTPTHVRSRTPTVRIPAQDSHVASTPRRPSRKSMRTEHSASSYGAFASVETATANQFHLPPRHSKPHLSQRSCGDNRSATPQARRHRHKPAGKSKHVNSGSSQVAHIPMSTRR